MDAFKIEPKRKIFHVSWLSILLAFFCLINFNELHGQSAMTNAAGRKTISLNGSWKVIPDFTGAGDYRQVWLEKKPVKKTDFVEYSFEGGPTLNVPGDFNTQMTELAYEEGTVWYKKTFDYKKNPQKRVFLHFGAVNYIGGCLPER